MSRLRAGCLNEGWTALRTAIDAVTPRLGRVIVIREAGCVSAEWAA